MHTLIIGMSESGKTLLSKLIAKELKRQGKKVAVLDPLRDPDWGADFITSDPDLFIEYLQSNRSLFVFVDESGEIFNEGNATEYNWLATRSRHYGHSVFFLAQRAIQVPKTMRDQCSKLYLFTSSNSDGKLHAEEWNKNELTRCNTLPQLHFFACSRYGVLQKGEILNYKKVKIQNATTNAKS